MSFSSAENPPGDCRSCQERLRSDLKHVAVDEKLIIKFQDVIGISLSFNPCLSPAMVCTKCSEKIEEFFVFKRDILEKQLKLNEFSEVTAIKLEPVGHSGHSPADVVKTVYEEESSNGFEPSFDDDNPFLDYRPKYKKPKVKKKPIVRKPRKPPNPDDLVCPICRKTYKDKRITKAHILRMHKTTKSVYCDICDYACFNKTEIMIHMRNNHLPKVDDPSKLRICPYCAKVLKGNSQLNAHIKEKHLKIVKFICDKCPFKTHGSYEMRRHFEVHHLPLKQRKNFPCDFEGCQAIMTTAASLMTHKKLKHSTQKDFVCSICGKAFALKQMLTSHFRNIHLGDKPFVCTYAECGKRFIASYQLRGHVDRVHKGIIVNEDVPPCNVCGKIFNTRNHLQSHMKYHKDPEFTCSYCEKKFYVRSARDNHQLTAHLGKTFDCEFCDKKFGSKDGLRRHVKQHHQN